MESLIDQPMARIGEPGRIWKGVATGALGLFFCYRGVLLYFDPAASQRSRAMFMGILLVLLATQYFSGASRESRLWLWRAFWAVPVVDTVLIAFEWAPHSMRRAEPWALLVTGAVMLLITAVWAAYRLGVRSALRRQSEEK